MNTSDDVYLNYKQASEHLQSRGLTGCGYWTIQAWAKSGKLPFIRPVGRPVISRAALDRWVDTQQREKEREVASRGAALARRRKPG